MGRVLIIFLILLIMMFSACSSSSPPTSYYNRNYSQHGGIVDDWRDYCARNRDCATEEIPK